MYRNTTFISLIRLKYFTIRFTRRHVILPIDLAKHVPKTHLMSETEWRNLGVQQSPRWVHYMMHSPGMSFRRISIFITHYIIY